jgi:hypothetical protein
MLPVGQVLWLQELGESLFIGAVLWLSPLVGARDSWLPVVLFILCTWRAGLRRTKKYRKRLKEIDLHDVLIVWILKTPAVSSLRDEIFKGSKS